ncbi:hypothetical protein MNBD_BACTEROID05-1105 [hydrothermal vent metagenome]|uniref:dolichyl-phosphate beta-glucosyltransferase n=1 Tax=hydrothermal vent metagenome TaxID=652676 RepID=A0A3B0TRK4_9ZZZZ
MNTPSLSVIIPAYNEQEMIGSTIEEVGLFLKKNFPSYEIIVVDDGSTDNTKDIVSKVSNYHSSIKLISHYPNKGKGISVKEGIMQSKCDYVLFSDADLSTPIDEILKFMPFFDQGADVVIGSRALKESDLIKSQGIIRQNMGRFFNVLVQSLVLKGIKDTQCGFKCFKRSVARDVFSRQILSGFSFDAEILFIADDLNYVIKEVPVKWINREASRVSVVRDSLKMVRELFVIRDNQRKGRYSQIRKEENLEVG